MQKTALSDPDFIGRIIRKYHKGKILLRHPIMIFMKNIGKFISQKINIDLMIGFDFKDISHIRIMKNLVQIKYWMSGIGKIQGYLRKITLKELGMMIFPAGNDTRQFLYYGGSPIFPYQIKYPVVNRTGSQSSYYKTIFTNDHPVSYQVAFPRFSKHFDHMINYHISNQFISFQKISPSGMHAGILHNYYFMQKWIKNVPSYPALCNISFSTYPGPRGTGSGIYDSPGAGGKFIIPSIIGNMPTKILPGYNEKKYRIPGILYHINQANSAPGKIVESGTAGAQERIGLDKKIKGQLRRTELNDITRINVQLHYKNVNYGIRPGGIIKKPGISKDSNDNRPMINPFIPNKDPTFYSTYKNSFYFIMQNRIFENNSILEHYPYRSVIEAMKYTNISPINGYDNKRNVFTFDKREKIEHEINEIKKMIVETKESIKLKRERSHAIGQREIDIDVNGISERVIKNLERNIMIEKERRGL